MDTKKIDQRFFGRDTNPLDLEITESKNSFIIDSTGKKYIDFLGGWCVGNWGWGDKEMEKVLQRPHPTYVHPSLLYAPWALLAEMLARITPGNLTTSYRTTGGSESVEAAMQIAMLYTKRQKFISIEGSYHGNTIGALSIGSSEHRKKMPGLLPGCLKITPPLNQKSLDKIGALLKKKDIAAFIMEPIICNMGVIVPEKDFMSELAALCKKYGTLLVMDEVASGFGRTGKLFASEHYNINPDILCLAKALTGGYAGMGVTMTNDRIAKYIKKDFHFYSTYGWHPLSVNAALANVSGWISQKDERLKQVEQMSKVFTEKLHAIKFRGDAKINIKGLAIGIEVKNSRYAKRISEKCLEKGLLLQAEESILFIFPPLNITKKVAEQGLEILEQCV